MSHGLPAGDWSAWPGTTAQWVTAGAANGRAGRRRDEGCEERLSQWQDRERGGVSEESGKLFHDAELKPNMKPGRREPLGKNVKIETVGYSRI